MSRLLTLVVCMLVAGAAAGVSGGGRPGCLSTADAADAMTAVDAELLGPVQATAAGFTCRFAGFPRKDASPTMLLTVQVSAPGEKPALAAMKEGVCRMAALVSTSESTAACASATQAVEEKSPSRLIRLLHRMASKTGDTVILTDSLIGSDAGFVWQPDPGTRLVGSVAIFYVEKAKRFVTVHCAAIYQKNARDLDCATYAAASVHADLVK